MTLTVEDDFREFVAARWPDLEGVAFVVTLDAATARRVTTDALATLHQQWREALDEGRPGATARRSVLAAAVRGGDRARRPAAAAPSTRWPARCRPAPPDPWADPATTTRCCTALEAVVRAATPLERALVAAGSVWGAGPDEVADLLGMPVADVRERAAALRGRLAAAHDAARVAEGLAPADWALDVDLDAVVEHLLAGQGDPPDPAALVEDRRRSVRRRSVVAGGAAAVAAGAVGWWLAFAPWPGPGRAAPPPLGQHAPVRPARRRRPELGQRRRAGRARGRLATDAAGAGPGHQPGERRRSPAVGRRRDGPARRGRRRHPQPGHRGRHPAGLAGRGRGATRPPCRRCRCRARSWPAGQDAVAARAADLPRHPAARAGPAHRHRGAVLPDRASRPWPAPSAAAGRRWR